MNFILFKINNLIKSKISILWILISNILLYFFTIYISPEPAIVSAPVNNLLPTAPGFTRLILPIDFIFPPKAQQYFELRAKNYHSFFITARYLGPARSEESSSLQTEDHWSGKHMIEINEKDLAALKLSQNKEQMQSLDSWIGLPHLAPIFLKNKNHQFTKESYEEIVF